MKKLDRGHIDPSTAPRRRSARRRKVLKGGWLVLADGTSSIRCFIKDISATGARLETPDLTDDGAASHLKLTLSDGETMEAELVRRTGLELGIRFVGQRRPSLAPPLEPVEQLVETMETMGLDDLLARIDDLGLSNDPNIQEAAEALGEAFATLYARISERAGPW